MEAACRDVSDTHHRVDYDHYVRALSSNPRSAGVHRLAVLATRLAVAHAASTEAKIGDLAGLEAEEDDPARGPRGTHERRPSDDG